MKHAILTGASSGLGRSLALELLNDGFHVVLVGRNTAAMSEIEKNFPGKVSVVAADLSQPEGYEGLIAKCEAKLPGAVDLLVNCAGFSVTGKIEEIPKDAYEKCWNVNFSAPVSLIRQVLPSMKKAGSGMIVNVGSGVARRALPFTSPYCSAKAALANFTDSLRVELAGTGLHVLLFSPGPVTSNFHQAMQHYGSPLSFPPFYGKPADKIAKKLFSAIQKEKTRVTLGGRASIAHHLNYWSPRLTDFIVTRLYKQK